MVFAQLSKWFVFAFSFTGFDTSCIFFPHLLPATCFPALGISCMFSRAWHRLHVFPRLVSVAYFPALGTGCMFSRAWHQLHVFPRAAPMICFRTFGSSCFFTLFLRMSCLYVLPVIAILASVKCLSTFGTICTFLPPLTPVVCSPAVVFLALVTAVCFPWHRNLRIV